MNHFRDCVPAECRCEEKTYREVSAAAAAIAFVAFVGGWFADSLALMSEAPHMLVDGIADVISYIVALLVRRSRAAEARIRSIGGLASALLLGATASWIFFEALKRLKTPHEVDTERMIFVALLAVLGNSLRYVILRRAKADQVTYRSAARHVRSDLGHSLGVALGGATIALMKGRASPVDYLLIDPILSLIVACFMIFWTLKIINESLNENSDQRRP